MGKPGMPQSLGSQRVWHDWATEKQLWVLLWCGNLPSFPAACGLFSFFPIAVAYRTFSCALRTLHWGPWDLVPWPRVPPRPPALGAQSLSHWTTRQFLHLPYSWRCFSRNLTCRRLIEILLASDTLWEISRNSCPLTVCVCVCVCVWVAQSCPTVTPWTVAHQAPLLMGILQARILQWVAMPSFRGSS